MEADNPTYVFENGRVFAIVEGKVIASASEIDEVEAILADPKENVPKAATHIVTPNGLKGRILGRHTDVWGDTVTVRFENGRIASFHTAVAEDFGFSIETPEVPVAKVLALESRLDDNFSADKASLQARLAELEQIQKEAAGEIGKASQEDAFKLDSITAMARHEAQEIKDVIANYDDHEAQHGYLPPAPFKMEAAEQESLGGNPSSWLDHTLGEMIEEAEATDFDSLMNEGPELFMADVENAALGDAGGVRQMASSFIRSRVVGIEPKVASQYETAFLARIEQVRRQELQNRKEKVVKEAKSQLDHDGPAEGLFL